MTPRKPARPEGIQQRADLAWSIANATAPAKAVAQGKISAAAAACKYIHDPQPQEPAARR